MLVYNNLGSLLIFQLILWLVQIVIAPFLWLTRDKWLPKYLRITRDLLQEKQDNFWNSQLQFWSQNYLVFCVAGFITIIEPRFKGTDSEHFSTALSVILVIFSVALPLWLYRFYSKGLRQPPVARYQFVKKYGSLLKGLHGMNT